MNDGAAEVEKQVQKAVVEGKDQAGSFHQMVEVGVLSRTHANPFFALVGVEELLRSEPFVLELLVKAIDL